MLELDVPSSGRAFVELTTPAVVAVDGDGSTSSAWDMAFEGYSVFTNSGLSGPGEAGALGPYAPAIFDTGV
ncbi:MAG TPA: HmuY family protein, partial [Polyangiaceae bacterium]|nr:HmuY family protein [Polyangiaceae bacterium]